MGCGRSKFHSNEDSEHHSKTNGVDKESKKNSEEISKFRTRRCTPAVNTNGALQQSSFNSQDRAFEKFSLNKQIGNKAISPQVLRVTNSQLEFFKMLDEKIEQGGHFSSDDEDEVIYQSTENMNSNS